MSLQQLMVWAVAFLFASEMAYTVVTKRPAPSKGGVLSLLPLLPLFMYLPWLPSSCHIRTVFAMVLLWTAPCKLLLLCLDAPIDPFPSSFCQFLAATFLPVRVSAYNDPDLSMASSSKGDYDRDPSMPSSSKGDSGNNQPLSTCTSARCGYGLLLVMIKVVLLVAILNIYSVFPSMPGPLLCFLYCCQFYVGLELFLGGVVGMVERGFSWRLHAPFNEPLKSVSLAEFWGKRWNLMINSILKETVYKPILRMRPLPTTQASKALAMLASFTASGLFHEIIFIYVSKSPPTGEMAAFFVLHGLATLTEVAIAQRWPAARRLLPTWACTGLTITFVCVTMSIFFIGPLRRSKTDVQAIAEYHHLQSSLLNAMGFTSDRSGPMVL